MTTDVLAYVRVSTSEQGASGLGMEAQREAIRNAAEARSWNVVEWIEDTGSGKSLNREGIQHALTRLENGGPKVLVAAKLDRISRSAIDFLTIVERAQENGWALILLEPNVDMTDAMGRFTAGVLAQVAQLEREMISDRTRDAMAVAKQKGKRLGRPVKLDQGTRERIAAMRTDGQSLQSIADTLNDEGVPTARGGQWWPSTVSHVVQSVELDAAAEAKRRQREQESAETR